MLRRPLRIATTVQWEVPCRKAGFDVHLLPEIPSLDFNRSLQQRLADGAVFRPFFEKHDIELVLDFNTSALTLSPHPTNAGEFDLTTAALGIPYVACYLDPITSTMAQVAWQDHLNILESPSWVKWIWEGAHADELSRLGIPNIVTLPMAVADEAFDTSPLPEPDPGPAIAFMGHPATTWFQSNQTVAARDLFVGMTAAAVHADMPDLPFHKIYFDLHRFGPPPAAGDTPDARAQLTQAYFNQKFVYNAYLALKQRDRFVRFLSQHLGDTFELIGDQWGTVYGLKHTPRIWDMAVLHARMRRVPICLNLMKGSLESGLNVRHFEITAHGGFMLTYETPELSSCFRIGEECDVFHDEAELLDKIDHYISHPDERRAIAAAGQRRTLSEHLYSHRLLKLMRLLCDAGVLPKSIIDDAPADQDGPAPSPQESAKPPVEAVSP